MVLNGTRRAECTLLHRHRQRPAAGHSAEEACNKRVPCAHGIDDINASRGTAVKLLAIPDDAAIFTQRDDSDACAVRNYRLHSLP